MKKLILCVLLSISLASCSQNVLNFTIVSTKNIELEKLSTFEKSSKKTMGEDMSGIIIIIPTKTIRIDQAITNTIDGIPGCVALVDGVVHSKFWWIPYIYGEQRYVVEATPLIDPSLAETDQVLPKYGIAHLDKKGNLKSIEAVSEQEYNRKKRKIVKHTKMTTLRNTQL